MDALKIVNDRTGMGVSIKKITGFTTRELNELGSMEHDEFREKVLDMLDRRNNGTGSCWQCGYGVYQMWISGDAVYAEVGNSCD